MGDISTSCEFEHFVREEDFAPPRPPPLSCSEWLRYQVKPGFYRTYCRFVEGLGGISGQTGVGPWYHWGASWASKPYRVFDEKNNKWIWVEPQPPPGLNPKNQPRFHIGDIPRSR